MTNKVLELLRIENRALDQSVSNYLYEATVLKIRIARVLKM